MREIKFEAWDKIGKVMLTWEDVKQWTLSDFEREDFILRQYTGLKDKNGREIYEGDIVQSEGSYPLEVFWKGIGWCFRWNDNGNLEEELISDDDGDVSFDENLTFGYLETIGNIYENPEILEEKR